MSRSAARDLLGKALVAAAFAILTTTPVHAQDLDSSSAAPAQTSTAEDALEASRDTYGPPRPRTCEPAADGEIVVCARPVDNEQFRVDSDTASGQAVGDGVPRAPDVSGAYIFKGPATVGGLCGFGLKGCPPPPIYIVDFDALPDAPPGSDAGRISRGLPPLGNAAREAPVTAKAAEESAAPQPE